MLLAVGAVLALVGLAVVLFIAWDTFDTWRLTRGDLEPTYGFTPSKIDRGTQILDYANEDVLRGIANHHGLDGPPAKIEKSKRRGFRGGPKSLQGVAENGTKIVHEPLDDLAELLRRLLGYLHEAGQLDQSADCVLADSIIDNRVPPPFLHEEEIAKEYFEEWLSAKYPNGLGGVSTEELAVALAAVGRTPEAGRVKSALISNFAALDDGSDQLLFLEGEWAIAEENGHISLSRTNLRLAYLPGEVDSTASIPMPQGTSITTKLDRDALTSHGKNRMVGVTKPIRASIVATLRQYDEKSGCLEVVPVAVFQRLAG